MLFGKRKPTDAGPVPVAQFNPILGAIDADIAVSRLESAGIPAVRFPTGALSGAPMGIVGNEPIRVFVAAERAEEAREVLVGDDSGNHG